MFEKLIALFERFVVAQEKMVALMSAQPCVVQPTTEIPAPPAPESNPGPQTAQETAKQADLDKWNPYDADLQKAYRADKQAILDAELAVLGIDGTGMTGAQKHEAILNHMAPDLVEDEDENPELPEEPQENPFDAPAEEPAKEITHEELITELRSYMETFPDITEGKKAVSDLLKNSVGVPNISAVPEDKRGVVIAAIPRAA